MLLETIEFGLRAGIPALVVSGPNARLVRTGITTTTGTFAMSRLAIPACIASLTAAPLPAFAYSCALSPARDAVIVKTDNASDREMTCKVECLFTSPEGPVTISCAQPIPANRKGWYVCLRPTGGKALEFVRGSESCQ